MGWAGAEAGAGAAGASTGGGVRTRDVTLEMPERLDSSVRNSDVKANVPARIEVKFFMKLEPDGVLISESPPPPKTFKPAPRPVCRSTTRIIRTQAITWTVKRKS